MESNICDITPLGKAIDLTLKQYLASSGTLVDNESFSKRQRCGKIFANNTL